MTKFYGPRTGVGTNVTETEAAPKLIPGARGYVAWPTPLQRGPIGELIEVRSKAEMRRKCGGSLEDYHGPDLVDDYFDHSEGAGGVFLLRITDGNERKASIPVYARHADHTPIGTIEAKNGGRWGGVTAAYTGEVGDPNGDIQATVLETGVTTWTTDELKGGYLQLKNVPWKQYPIIGNTSDGKIFVPPDKKMEDDVLIGGGPLSGRWYVVMDPGSKGLQVQFVDGARDPENAFGVVVTLDGEEVKAWHDLTLDTWVDAINNDRTNEYLTVNMTYGGEQTADMRPANDYGRGAALTERTLTIQTEKLFYDNVPSGSTAYVGMGATTDDHRAQTITLTMTSPTAFDAVSDRFGNLGSGNLDALFEPNNKWTPTFTFFSSGPAAAAGDEFRLVFRPLVPGALVGGRVFPDNKNLPRLSYLIASNDHKTVTAVVGSTMMTDVGGDPSNEYMFSFAQKLQGGRDGHADLTDDHFLEAFDLETSPFVELNTRAGFGMVRFGLPGIESIAIDRAMRDFCWKHGYTNRFSIPPSGMGTLDAVEGRLKEDIGVNYNSVANALGYVYVKRNGKDTLWPTLGMIQGREAKMARDVQGYHRPAGGISVTLPKVIRLAQTDERFDPERLGALGIGNIVKKGGDYVLWDGQGSSLDQTQEWFRFITVREEQLDWWHNWQKSFDWVLFQLNDPALHASVYASFDQFLEERYRAKAINNFLPKEEAYEILLNAENNTLADQAAGNVNAEISWVPTGFVQRLQITVGPKGVELLQG